MLIVKKPYLKVLLDVFCFLGKGTGKICAFPDPTPLTVEIFLCVFLGFRVKQNFMFHLCLWL